MKKLEVGKIPDELKALPNWVTYRLEERDGRLTKVPYTPSGSRARANDPSTWSSFDACLQATGFAGIGFQFSPPFVGADLDKCRSWMTGKIEGWAQAIMTRLNSYTEVSVSGTGIHMLLKGALPPGRRREGNVELYNGARYFTITGHHLEGTPLTIEDRTSELAALHAEIFPPVYSHPIPEPAALTLADDELIQKASTAANGARFSALWRGVWQGLGYPSQSEADGALCCILAFWCGGDESRIDSLFRQSGLMRPKWSLRHAYRTRTIQYAVGRVNQFYSRTG
jgi:putative DNA primase/helicase